MGLNLLQVSPKSHPTSTTLGGAPAASLKPAHCGAWMLRVFFVLHRDAERGHGREGPSRVRRMSGAYTVPQSGSLCQSCSAKMGAGLAAACARVRGDGKI